MRERLAGRERECGSCNPVPESKRFQNGSHVHLMIHTWQISHVAHQQGSRVTFSTRNTTNGPSLELSKLYLWVEVLEHYHLPHIQCAPCYNINVMYTPTVFRCLCLTCNYTCTHTRVLQSKDITLRERFIYSHRKLTRCTRHSYGTEDSQSIM